MNDKTFGEFLTQTRLGRDMTLRGLAGKLGISPVYMCNIENNRRSAPSAEILERMAALLSLSADERVEMLDLAAKSKNTPAVAVDLPEYINERDVVRVALRTAKDAGATDAEWLEFVDKIRRRAEHENHSGDGLADANGG